MALVLTLHPQQRIILGGAVVRNQGIHSAHLMIETEVPILRGADILPESETKTPCKRIYTAIELLYILPDEQEASMKLFLELTREVLAAAPSMKPQLEEVSLLVLAGDFYKALQKMKPVMRREQALLARAASATP
jgi:flagellar protein FlbT